MAAETMRLTSHSAGKEDNPVQNNENVKEWQILVKNHNPWDEQMMVMTMTSDNKDKHKDKLIENHKDNHTDIHKNHHKDNRKYNIILKL